MTSEPVYPFETIGFGDHMEVHPGIHWVRMPLPFALNHVNLWLIEDGEGWTVVDTGYNTEETRDFWDKALARILRGRPITRIIVTHFHPDHLGLAGWFAEKWRAMLWMTYAEWLQAHLGASNSVTHDMDRWVDFFIQNGLDEVRGASYRASRTDFGQIMAPIPVTLHRISDNDVFTINGHAWRVITGGGHSPNHACLYCPALNVLISGDQVLPRITTNISLWFTEPDGDPLRLFLTSFDKFRSLPEDVLVLPSHNRPFRGLFPRFDALRAHHAERLDHVVAACANARTAAEIIPQLFNRPLDDHQLGFAMGESLSHLNYLVNEGRLRRFHGSDGKIRYERLS
jgi:glyoxylase-like metal-dependent hydrolase (beta-lactamase superfamily II)